MWHISSNWFRPFKLTVLLLVLLSTGCMSYGPTIRIETPEPAQDFVVVCEWFGGRGIIAGSGSRQSYKVFITESGKEVDCGLGFSASNQALIMHPLYTEMQGVDEDGIRVVRPKNKLQILDEQKAKFEAGYWGKYDNPLELYYKSLPGCGFPMGYFDYYNEVKDVDIEYFKKKYNAPIFECHKQRYPILKLYDPYTYSKIPSLSKRMEQFWNADEWKRFK